MKSIAETLKSRSVEWAPHELAATVNSIIAIVGDHPKYNYRYWLGKVKRSGKTFTGMHGILKGIADMDKKYSKGGRLTNILDESAKRRKLMKQETYYITIKKPLYGNYVYIRHEVLRDAHMAYQKGARVVVKIPQGEGEIIPLEWKKNGKVMKKVFLRPDEPMVLYGGFVPLPGVAGSKVEKKVKQEDIQSKLF